MTTFTAQYRLEIRKPRSAGVTEADALVPVAGAVHSDPFRVSSKIGDTGWQPYLDPGSIRGRRGRINLRERRLDKGVITVRLTDKKVGASGGNLERWWSALFGDVKGKPYGQLKALMWESLDNGATWPPFWTGRLVRSQLEGKSRVVLTIDDELESLKMPIFTGPPHPSVGYAAPHGLLPLGVISPAAYGPLRSSTAFVAIAETQELTGVGDVRIDTRLVRINRFDINRDDLLLRAGLSRAVNAKFRTAGYTAGMAVAGTFVSDFTGTARARLTHVNGALSGQTGDYQVGLLGLNDKREDDEYVDEFSIQALDTSDSEYLALPADGVSVMGFIFDSAAPSGDAPLLINDVEAVTLLADLCAGKFSALYNPPLALSTGSTFGDVRRSVPTHPSLATQAGTGRPPFRAPITKKDKLIDFIEKYLLFPNNWAAFLDAEGRLNLVDLNLPATTAGLPTITDADLVADQSIQWEHDPTSAMTSVLFTTYVDTLAGDVLLPPRPTGGVRRAVPRPLRPGELGDTVVASEEHLFGIVDLGSVDFGDEDVEIDALGIRYVDDEELQGQLREHYLRGKLDAVANALRRPWAYGEATATIACRRTATVSALWPGTLVLTSISALPDPATHKRGGTRVCRVLERSENGPSITLRLLDLAIPTVASVPTLAAPALETNNGYTGVTVAITLNAAGQPVEVRYAVTATSVGTVPVDDSALWTTARQEDGRKTLIRTSSTLTIRTAAPGKRIWIQGRSMPDDRTEPHLPSAWVNAASPGRVDTTALPAPSAASNSLVTSKSARVSWTNGSPNLPTEVWSLTPGTFVPIQRIATLLPESIRHDVIGLVPSTEYCFGVCHVFARFRSAFSTTTFTTASSGPVAPPIRGIAIRR